MSKVLKDLKIKTGSAVRLGKELKFYEKEKQAFADKLKNMEENKEEQLNINKQREFLDETEATLQNVKSRLEDAYTALDTYLQQNAAHADVVGTEELEKAQQVWKEEGEPFLNSLKGDEAKADDSDDCDFS
eukprot:CAMPEP_0175156970 /NCGR_PEP_ID=MMETSP0087-20121206/21924_1 /TAXON_ID=136419 /ORGANISM="Unknown Unknown, Strain D1" /LENGTH=130 /DNA_ID=CAMNT_0016444491 /DNA_START=33 /DNA_END=425 /DNA_ORIENTATION=+